MDYYVEASSLVTSESGRESLIQKNQCWALSPEAPWTEIYSGHPIVGSDPQVGLRSPPPSRKQFYWC